MRIGIFGAGAIGCWLGGRLQLAGHAVVFVGRAAVRDSLGSGLRLSDERAEQVLVREDINYHLSAEALRGCAYVLVTVKSAATAEAGLALAEVLDPSTIIVSFQNGVKNAERLRETMPHHRVLGGMVPFNVTRTADGRFHRGTRGPLVVEALDQLEAPLLEILNSAELPAQSHPDIQGVLYGKLLFNLNNALNALAGIPLREQLLEPDYRKILAEAIDEGQRVFRAANIRAVSFGRMNPRVVALGLRMPTFLFLRAAKAMLAIDAEARSSMYDDLQKRRLTEIDELNGEIVRLGAQHNVPTPVNSRIVARIREAERNGEGSPHLDAARIRGLN